MKRNNDGSYFYRGVIIQPRNRFGMYSARVNVPNGGVPVAADTLAGMRGAITETLRANDWPRQ